MTFYHDGICQACHCRKFEFGILPNQTMIALHYALVRRLAITLYWPPYSRNLGGQNHDAKRGTIGGHRNTDWQS